jgi:hypothetical protein
MMSSKRAVLLALSLAFVSGCHDESAPPRSAGEPGKPADTDINRTHGEVKTELNRAAEKTRRAADGLQRDIQEGARRGADQLGVRRSAAGISGRAADGGS